MNNLLNLIILHVSGDITIIMKNNIFLIKQLRELTGAGLIECKKALIQTKYNINNAVDFLRNLGKIRAFEQLTNKTIQGSIFIENKDNCGSMIELNSETDFVAKSKEFITFGKSIVNLSISDQIDDINTLRNKCEEKRIELVLKVRENINIQKFILLKSNNIISYLHRDRIGVLIVFINKNNNLELLKQIAMHIAASKPRFLSMHDIPQSIIDREYKIQLSIVSKLDKPKLILDRIIEGRMKKFKSEISLLTQPFVIDRTKTIQQLLKENNLQIESYFRFEVGEII
ncbi:elongation factor Ts [Buchnera aphidicola (Hormaphis cornu)]|nr:elongation factor Ts [Buchnera aphidicola (Hormaphis cornu)]